MSFFSTSSLHSTTRYFVCHHQTGARAGETFIERVVCLAVSLQSSAVLNCIALWMQVSLHVYSLSLLILCSSSKFMPLHIYMYCI